MRISGNWLQGYSFAFLLFSRLDSAIDHNAVPLSLTLEYVFPFFHHMFKVVNRISEQIIEELQFDQTAESMSRGIIGLCSDASAGLFYAYDQNSIFQVCMAGLFHLIYLCAVHVVTCPCPPPSFLRYERVLWACTVNDF